MEVGRDGDLVVVKLGRGEDLLPVLGEALRGEGVTSGVVLAGIGALEDVELGWFDPRSKSYVRNAYAESRELLSLQGTVTLEADLPLHLHAALADAEQRVVGGHLFRGRVAVLAEVAVRGLDGLALTRLENPATGLLELTMGGREPTT